MLKFELYVIFMCHKISFFFWFLQPIKYVKILAHSTYKTKQQVGFGSRVIVCWPLVWLVHRTLVCSPLWSHFPLFCPSVTTLQPRWPLIFIHKHARLAPASGPVPCCSFCLENFALRCSQGWFLHHSLSGSQLKCHFFIEAISNHQSLSGHYYPRHCLWFHCVLLPYYIYLLASKHIYLLECNFFDIKMVFCLSEHGCSVPRTVSGTW